MYLISKAVQGTRHCFAKVYLAIHILSVFCFPFVTSGFQFCLFMKRLSFRQELWAESNRSKTNKDDIRGGRHMNGYDKRKRMRQALEKEIHSNSNGREVSASRGQSGRRCRHCSRLPSRHGCCCSCRMFSLSGTILRGPELNFPLGHDPAAACEAHLGFQQRAA